MAEPWYATAFGAFYPVLYGHRDEGEARACLDLLHRLAPLEAPVLDLGCGDGRHLAHLAATDGMALGLDLSAPLLAAARARPEGPSLDLLRGDLRHLPLADASCGTVLSLFTAFGYFADAAENALPVAEIGRVLIPGGHWCLDYFDADRVREELGTGETVGRHRQAGPLDVREDRSYDEARSMVRKTVNLNPLPGRESEARQLGVGAGGLAYAEEVMVFTLAELDAMAAGAGLQRTAAAGDYRGGALGTGDRWLLVYTRESGTAAP